MKLRYLTLLSALAFGFVRAIALTIPSNGSDGAFNPTSDIVIDLSLAPTGAWNANNGANSGKGVYDASKWAVVFNYTSVNIPNGVKVTFKNHPTHAPVVWLVSGNVTISGTLSLVGQDSPPDEISRLLPAEPGPGGFRAGASGPSGKGWGYGPGGNAGSNVGGGAGVYGILYGNPQILPLIGGSGAGIWNGGGGYSGGAGGGAILIACAGGVSVNGTINASGGSGLVNGTDLGLGGSGGAVRIIAETVSGIGEILALNPLFEDGYGRIRIESSAMAASVRTSPETVAVTPAAFPIIWPADDAPQVRVTMVDGTATPVDPTASVVSTSDVKIANNGTVQVVLEATNFPISGVVQLRSVMKYGAAAWVNAAFVDGNFANSRWVANVTFAPGFTTLQARATVP